MAFAPHEIGHGLGLIGSFVQPAPDERLGLASPLSPAVALAVLLLGCRARKRYRRA